MASMLAAIDIFAGIGCASYGFKKAGFDIKAALEIKPERCDTYKANLGFRPIEEDIMRIKGGEILAVSGLKRREDFCMIGCPPCQSFSSLSETTGIDPLKDPRSKYVLKFATLVEELKPTVVVFENVPGMFNGQGRLYFDKYMKRLKLAGYETVFDIVNAANYGIPQNRKRLLAISVLKGSKRVELPLLSGGQRDLRTVRDTIGDLPRLEAGEVSRKDPLHKARLHTEKVMRMIRKIPKDGGSRKDLPYRLWLPCHRDMKGAESVYGRMRWDKPSPTITCRCISPSCGRFLHPDQDRAITIREAARLQTIPDSFKLTTTTNLLEEMIGDAVPVKLVTQIAKKVSPLLAN